MKSMYPHACINVEWNMMGTAHHLTAKSNLAIRPKIPDMIGNSQIQA